MSDDEIRGLAEAWKAFERTRDRADCDAVAVRLRLLCNPTGVRIHSIAAGENFEFGMQDKAGSLIPGTPLPDDGREFKIGVVAKRNRASGDLRYVGPFVAGPAGDEFLYLSWRQAGKPGWLMRIKMRLTTLEWDKMVEADKVSQTFTFDATGREPHDRRPAVWQIA